MVYNSLIPIIIYSEIKYLLYDAKFNKKSVTFAQKWSEKIQTNQ